MAFICDLCNFVRFDKTEIEKHLICEHDGEIDTKFKEVLFLRFPEGSNNRNITQPMTIQEETAEELRSNITQPMTNQEETAEELQSKLNHIITFLSHSHLS